MKANTSSRGQMAVLKVQLICAERNTIVSFPTVDVNGYDIILESDNKLSRAQIKYCDRLHGNNLELRLDNKKSKRLFYTEKDVDLLLVYVPKIDKVLKYDGNFFHNKKTLFINLNNEKSKWHYKKFTW